jgi:peptide deformylase
MSILKIVHYPDPILLTVGKPFGDDEFNDDLRTLVEDMFATMYDAQGVGLAAPQVGISKRLFVMDVPTEDDKSNKIALINPEIMVQEGEQIGDEGCLSFPGIYTTVQREVRTIVRYRDPFGKEQELDCTNLSARCVLHETDHCDGIVFLDRMSVLKREFAKRKIRKLQKTGKWD